MSLENVNLRERRQSPQNIRPDLCAVSRLHYVKKPGKPRKTETRFIWPTGGGGVVKWAVSTLGVQGLFWGGGSVENVNLVVIMVAEYTRTH